MPVVYSPLNDSELDSICLSLVNQNLPYFSAFHEAFVLLYLTGCRVEEIFAVHRWERLQGYEMIFLPQKDNYWRYVTLDSRCDSFIDAVVGRYKPFGGLSSGQLNSLFYNFSEYSNYKVGSKPISLYLFRYNFIRKLHNSGLNINQIADKMGYTSTSVVGGYLTAEIEKGFFLDTDDFVQLGNLFWSKKDLDWSDGGDDILIRDFFGTGELSYYYRLSAVQRYLYSFPLFRLPSQSDFFLSSNYLSSQGFSGLRSLMMPSSVYWSSINSYMINNFDMRVFGSGYLSSGNLTSFRSSAFYFMSESSDSLYWTARLRPSDSSFSTFQTSTYSFFCVRLILFV
jgi:hypothetical protein